MFPPRCCSRRVKGASIYQKTMPLQPGRYRLNIAAKDIVGGNTTNFEMVLEVPRIEDDQLGPELVDPGGSIGESSHQEHRRRTVRDRHLQSAARAWTILSSAAEKLGIYLQLYNFEPDEKTKKPDGTVEYEITKNGSNEKVFEYTEDRSAR